jgi:hypothetical protein
MHRAPRRPALALVPILAFSLFALAVAGCKDAKQDYITFDAGTASEVKADTPAADTASGDSSHSDATADTGGADANRADASPDSAAVDGQTDDAVADAASEATTSDSGDDAEQGQ